ncbi:hypothetical protein DEO72_LG7g2915 [Vigna unguiculata]|uniref:Bifunctional inhibitor/plant lipid transfer protein/seed storage helical domain-containing protein n=1 Tax=Vigna unguiculata TaxID=3917 RepID=A0A4D6MJE8_VIGUN|nr:hypothetical protein DEO72_LG7g2915 [Vigna unguiculata]
MKMKIVFVTFFTLLVVFAAAQESSNGLTCDQEKSLFAPCFDFLTKKTDAPATSCCQGLKQIISSASTKEEKQAACSCLKDAASKFLPNIDKDRANHICQTCKSSTDLGCQK